MKRVDTIDRSQLRENTPNKLTGSRFAGLMEMECPVARVTMTTEAPLDRPAGDVTDSWVMLLSGQCKAEHDFYVIADNEVCRPPLKARVRLVASDNARIGAAGAASFCACSPNYAPDEQDPSELVELTIPTDPQRMRDILSLVGIPGVRFDMFWRVEATHVSNSHIYFDLAEQTSGFVSHFTISAILPAGRDDGPVT